VLACRSAERGARLEAALRAEHEARGLPPPSLEVRLLDLASLSSVRAFCEGFMMSGGKSSGRKTTRAATPTPPRPLHVLICNAGVFNMGVRERRETAEGGFEEHLACNHLGHFLLAVLLLPSLREGTRELEAAASSLLLPRARVVSVSSAMHHYGASLGADEADRADPQLKGVNKSSGSGKKGGGTTTTPSSGRYSTDRAYARSKLAQLLFTAELRRRAGHEVDALALHPGMVVTDVVRSLPPMVGAAYRALMGRLLLSPDEGCRASVVAATKREVGGASSSSSSWYLDANAEPVAPCAVAECPERAAWLWEWSAEAVGLREEEDVGVVVAKGGRRR
jgi:NAD(P)-dependent dehydrogenase (short-subunit alcohol dehydrogenase family)